MTKRFSDDVNYHLVDYHLVESGSYESGKFQLGFAIAGDWGLVKDKAATVFYPSSGLCVMAKCAWRESMWVSLYVDDPKM